MSRTVVHYIASDTYGGCEAVVLLLMKGLDKKLWRPVLFHHGSPGIQRLIDEVRQLGITCRMVPRISGSNIAVALRKFGRELLEIETKVFHAHLNWPLACRHATMAARFRRVPGIVATAHLGGPYSSSCTGVRFGWLQRRLLVSNVQRFIAVSHGVKRSLCQDMGVPESKVRVVHNGIQIGRFEQNPKPALRELLTQGSERPVVFTAARLHSEKGHADLLEAAALVPHALFVLAGEGPERASLEILARKLGIEARVRFLGQRHDMPQLLACSDLFVLPSYREGLPLTVIEAMAAGKAVISTAIGGTDEAVLNGTTGILVPPGNPAQLADAMSRLLSDHALATRLAKAGRKRVTEEFSSDAMVRGVTAIYKEVLGPCNRKLRSP